jgi:competence protein ComEC
MKFHVPVWKAFPFLRICAPFIAGILIANYTQAGLLSWLVLICLSLAGILTITWTTIEWQYTLRHIRGILLNSVIVSAGVIIASLKNPFASAEKTDNAIQATFFYIAHIREPPQEKKNSWKALAEVTCARADGKVICDGIDVIVYFTKDSSVTVPRYGDSIAFQKPPERIKNFVAGAAFDYQRYCALKNIHYQVFLRAGEYVRAGSRSTDAFHRSLFATQQYVLSILRRHIPGSKECGLAEALLIGYKNDLDKMLLQSYSDTGVVHVVAISGLHLGLVYIILGFLTSPLKTKLRMLFFRGAVIITGLWAFTFLSGASPSVLRSAVMFTAIMIGETIKRRSSVVNNLAASAFLLLCIDPFWLWDLGFILSYAALLALVIFMKPISGLIQSSNRFMDAVWKMIAGTVAAQILTLPVLIYYFKQFPNLFIITNLVAIPLSSIILMGEILMILLSFVQQAAGVMGVCLSFLIKIMNTVVELMDSFTFSSTRGIEINFVQLILLYVFIASMTYWLIIKIKFGLHASLVTLIIFFLAGNCKAWR